jgi:hypothetical protein
LFVGVRGLPPRDDSLGLAGPPKHGPSPEAHSRLADSPASAGFEATNPAAQAFSPASFAPSIRLLFLHPAVHPISRIRARHSYCRSVRGSHRQRACPLSSCLLAQLTSDETRLSMKISTAASLLSRKSIIALAPCTRSRLHLRPSSRWLDTNKWPLGAQLSPRPLPARSQSRSHSL